METIWTLLLEKDPRNLKSIDYIPFTYMKLITTCYSNGSPPKDSPLTAKMPIESQIIREVVKQEDAPLI